MSIAGEVEKHTTDTNGKVPIITAKPDDVVSKFTPTIQDRIAISIMEQTENALKLITMGQIEDAAKILARRKQWTSLPTGSENNNFTVADMMEYYQNFLIKIK